MNINTVLGTIIGNKENNNANNIIEENIQYLSQNNEDDSDQWGRRLDAYYSCIRITGLWCLCDANFTRKCKRNIACSSILLSIVFLIIAIVMSAINIREGK